MSRRLFSTPSYKPQFSGHETFPLRQLWLRKAFDAVQLYGPRAPRGVFSDQEAIALFGVGKNMVGAIRHWGLACDIIREVAGAYEVTELGELLFGDDGLDPYLEHPASAWLAHWQLAGEGRRSTTWYWLFNHVGSASFDRKTLANDLIAYCTEAKISKMSPNTIKRDVECCVRSYVPSSGAEAAEDITEPVLGDLGLLTHSRGAEFDFRFGAKPTLPDGIFLYALTRFWDTFAHGANTLSLDTVCYERGSPGMVFKIDIDSVAERLIDAQRSSDGVFAWAETAGLRQVIRKKEKIDPLVFLPQAYGQRRRRSQ